MSNLTAQEIDARYQSHFGVVAGYLPTNREAVDAWQRELIAEVRAARPTAAQRGRCASVAALAALIEVDGIVRMYVEEMIRQVPAPHRTIETVEELLDALETIITTAPLYNPDPAKRNSFPMSSLFVYMMMTRAGEAAFRNGPFNDALRNILKEWCAFLDGEGSLYVLNTGEDGWLSPSAYAYNKLDEFVIPDRSAPHWGWRSFNDYFHRQIKSERRPVAGPGDPRVIVSANDGTVYRIARGVKALDRFWIKGQPYSLVNMLNAGELVERFVGGDVFQSFLSGADYHRWRAPVAGVVRHAEVVEALMFSDAESAGTDTTAGTFSQGYEASVNTRGLVYIESDDPTIGMVCVIPIGITEISSVSIQVRAGDRVEKGDELGYFSYGGSSMCLVFQPGAIDRFTVPARSGGNPDDGPPILVNAQIAAAR
ncbi:MAG TPA: phophatidylserine decarboxylase associated domain-containing protein [Longimicrobium sp.]|nr:phophatidylserine decarboxylase associated domain-containing protein [Longimicrobium sp.]